MEQSIKLTDTAWTTIKATLYDRAERVQLPAGMQRHETDEWKIAKEIERQLPGDDLPAAAEAVAAFIGGAKDRLGRPDPAANDQMREARQTIQQLATAYGVQAGHATVLDQCAALLRAAAVRKAPSSERLVDTGRGPFFDFHEPRRG
jgi:hypothetical protein